MQILVVVANVQARILMIEVGKGFALTAIGRKLVGPKRNGNTMCFYVGGFRVGDITFGWCYQFFYTPSCLERESGLHSGTRASVVFLLIQVVTRKQ